jgi:N-acetylated-alpha-linked acidic dipeptidase
MLHAELTHRPPPLSAAVRPGPILPLLTFYWYTYFSDITFVYGRALSQWMGTALMRLAGAQVLPFEFTGLAETVERYAGEVEKLYQQEKQKDAKIPALDFSLLQAGVQALKTSAAGYQETLRKAEPASAGAEVNQALYGVERVMVEPRGLPGRDGYRHALYAPGAYTGYAVKTLPGAARRSWRPE